MFLRIALFALMAVGLLGFGAVAWVSTHPATPPAPPAPMVAEEAPPPPPPPPVKVSVTVAARSLRGGSFLRPDDLRAVEMDADKVPPGATPDSPAVRGSLNGAMLRRGVGENEPLTAVDVFKPSDHGFLASVLKPGMRAVTVGLTGAQAAAGFVWPGDRVDVILTEHFTDSDIRVRRQYASETVLEDVRVVAVDQQMVPGTASADEAKPNTSHSVVVEVRPEAAEHLAMAPLLGGLTVSLRPAYDTAEANEPARRPGAETVARLIPVALGGLPNEPKPRRVTWSGDVARATNLPVRPPPPAAPMQVFRGTSTARAAN